LGRIRRRSQDDLFDATGKRFLDLYWSDQNPSVRPDIDAALHAMATTVQKTLSDETAGAVDYAGWRGIWALGSAGYVWRIAESGARTTDLNRRADLAREVEAVVASGPPEASDEHVLGWAAGECVRRNLLFGSGSPGGWAGGGEFLRRGFRFVNRHLVPEDDVVPRQEGWYAFSFGVALYEVDECLAKKPAWSSRRTKPSAARAKLSR